MGKHTAASLSGTRFVAVRSHTHALRCICKPTV